MGLTSSQGRLLMLTSRLSDIQLDEIMISQRQNQLAWQSEKVAKEYQEKVTNMKLVMKVPDASETNGYRKTDVNYEDMASLGYLITNAAGDKVYLLPDENGKLKLPKATNLGEDEQDIFLGETYEKDGKTMATLANKDKTEVEVVDGSKLIGDKTKLQNNLMNGVIFVLNTTGENTSGLTVNQLEANTRYEWVQDTSDDAEAESKYNYETARISRQDNQLDMELKQLETQHNAIIKEIESVQKVIDDNIERTFKLFDG